MSKNVPNTIQKKHVQTKRERLEGQFDQITKMNVILLFVKTREKDKSTIRIRGREVYLKEETKDKKAGLTDISLFNGARSSKVTESTDIMKFNFQLKIRPDE